MNIRLYALAVCSALISTVGQDASAQVARPSTTAAAPSPLTGRYQLVGIDGHPIPFAARDPHAPANAPPPPEVIASSLVIRPDGSFLMAMGYRTTAGDVRFSVMPFSGTCAPDGDAFVARWDGAGQTRITLAGDTLLLNNVGMLFAYRKLR